MAERDSAYTVGTPEACSDLVGGAARGPSSLGRRSQAGKGARRCRVWGDLPAWRG